MKVLTILTQKTLGVNILRYIHVRSQGKAQESRSVGVCMNFVGGGRLDPDPQKVESLGEEEMGCTWKAEGFWDSSRYSIQIAMTEYDIPGTGALRTDGWSCVWAVYSNARCIGNDILSCLFPQQLVVEAVQNYTKYCI